MEIVSYWMNWSDACDFMFALEESGDYPEVAEKVREQIEDRYQGLAPYGPGKDDKIVFASRFEQDVIDVIEATDAPYDERKVVTVEE
jgi:hypothetical protein